jgi:hypothetical protein
MGKVVLDDGFHFDMQRTTDPESDAGVWYTSDHFINWIKLK